MKKAILCGFTGLLLVVVVIGAGRRPKQSSEFNALIKQYYEAWNTLDPDNAGPLYGKDADLVFFDLAPLQYTHGWKEYRDNFKTNLAPTFASINLKPNNDLKVTAREDVALTTLTFHVQLTPKQGEKIEFDGRHTIFWEKHGGRWLIAHEHVSKPL